MNFTTTTNCSNSTCHSNLSLTNPTPQWSAVPIVTLVNILLGVIGNGGLLYLFVRTPDLRTPFNVYVMFLLGSNIFSILFQYPFDIYSYIHSFIWQLDEHVCTFYVYVICVGLAIIYYAHVLIAINRIVAVKFPIRYRAIHSFRSNILQCAGVFVYAHLISLPGWALDTLYYRLPLDTNGCQLNYDALTVWCTIYAILFQLCPQAFIMLSFPFIWVVRKCKRRQAGKTKRIAPKPNSTISNVETVRAGCDDEETSRPPTGTVPHPKSHGFKLLALLTVSIMIFWTPNNIFYPLYAYRLINVELYVPVSTTLFACQTTMDPIVFALALPALRQAALHRWFRG